MPLFVIERNFAEQLQLTSDAARANLPADVIVEVTQLRPEAFT
jgi:hypothetical protein